MRKSFSWEKPPNCFRSHFCFSFFRSYLFLCSPKDIKKWPGWFWSRYSDETVSDFATQSSSLRVLMKTVPWHQMAPTVSVVTQITIEWSNPMSRKRWRQSTQQGIVRELRGWVIAWKRLGAGDYHANHRWMVLPHQPKRLGAGDYQNEFDGRWRRINLF
jgi:hypothetical protein